MTFDSDNGDIAVRMHAVIGWLALVAYLPLSLPLHAVVAAPSHECCCAACRAKRPSRTPATPERPRPPECPCGTICFACAKYLPTTESADVTDSKESALDCPADVDLILESHPFPTLRPPRPV